MRTLIPKQDDPAPEGAGLGESEVGLDVRWLKQPPSASDEDRVHVEPVLVDQVISHEGCRKVGPTQGKVSAGLFLELQHLGRHDVADHGGVIELDGGHGPGARFVVRLPRFAADPLADDRDQGTAPQALDVLVVSPDLYDSNFLTNFLASRGHAALAASDVDGALRLAEQMPFGAVICEARLAGGAEIVRALRSLPGCAATRFIIAAGGPETTARLPMPLPTGTTVVMRPYDLEELRLLLED